MDLTIKQALLLRVQEISHKASLLMLGADKACQTISKKGRIDLVTDTDVAVNQLLCKELSALDTRFGVIAEEGVPDELAKQNARHVWVIDPIDGTTNFVHGLMHSAISIALYDRQELESVIGLVYNPFRDECFTAIKGAGAHLNNIPIRVSETAGLIDSLIGTGFAYDVKSGPDNNLVEFASIIQQVQGLRRFGAASLDLAYVAAGRFDGYFEHGLKFWDYAAGMLLVSESGGLVTTYDKQSVGETSGHFLATNRHLHDDLLFAVVSARRKAGFPDVPQSLS